MNARIIVHGGAWDIPDEYVEAHISGVRAAIEEVASDLTSGVAALEAVERAVQIMEINPTFDAGRGAFLNAEGEVELDACIMDGQSLKFGAVGALKNFINPISIARKLLDHSEHCFLVAAGARKFALANGFDELPVEALVNQRELEYFAQIKNDPTFKTHLPFDKKGGTVGAVAIDLDGNIAAATSTGGTPRKHPGRVGDTPICGAGTYADNAAGGVSATGWGESIMRVLLAKSAVDMMETDTPQMVAQNCIRRLKNRVNGLGGIVGINTKREYVLGHNTPRMAWAYLAADGNVEAGIDWN